MYTHTQMNINKLSNPKQMGGLYWCQYSDYDNKP
jgi:hypothetical protein